VPTTYDFYMCDAPADDPDEALYEEMSERVDEQFPYHKGDERETMIYELMEKWKREQDDMRYGL